MTFIETHAHLYTQEFDDDREAVIRRAVDKGIEKFFLPAIDSTMTQRMYDLEATYPDRMFLMTGLHPVSVGELDYEKELLFVEQELKRKKFYALGEIGIDLHWYPKTLREQQDAFRRQIHMAKAHDLPIVIHCREAFDAVFEVLEEEKGPDLFGIFHCFTGSSGQAERAIDLGMKLGIGGILTFKNGGLDKFINRIPLEELVLETDSPYLAPTPYRGKRNESSYMIQVAQKLATLYEVDLQTIAEQTTETAQSIFKW